MRRWRTVFPTYDTTQGDQCVPASYNRAQIRAALAQTDPALSFYLDLASGNVVQINDADTAPEVEALRNQVMESYGDRYRYIPGGNTAADDTAVAEWIDAEGL